VSSAISDDLLLLEKQLVAARDQIHRSAVLLQAAQIRWRKEKRKLVAVRAELSATDLRHNAAKQSLQEAERLIVQLREAITFAPGTTDWDASEGARLRTELQASQVLVAQLLVADDRQKRELRKRISPEADSRRSATNCAIISLALQTLRATLSERFGPIPENPEET